MNTLHARLAKAFPFLGSRVATESDLLNYCAANDIKIVMAREVEKGIYVRHDSEDWIFLNANLYGRSLLYVLAHEIAHVVLHSPTRVRNAVHMFEGRLSRRQHIEAETAVSLLLITIDELQDILIEGRDRDDEHLADLIGYRLDHHRIYRK